MCSITEKQPTHDTPDSTGRKIALTTDQLIVEIELKARNIACKHQDDDGPAFSIWLQAEKEIRKKFGLPERPHSNPLDSC
jgi:hypothetical protein